MSKVDPFKYFKTSSAIIRLAVMYYVRYPLSFRQVEDILHERGIDVCHETIRYRVNRFGPRFAGSIRRKRTGHHSNWQWHLDEVFVKINGETHYLWRAVDHEGEVLECYVTRRRDRKSAKKFILKALRRYGYPHVVTTDRLLSYGAAFREIGIEGRQQCGGRSNNRCENSHLPFRRRERAMQRFRSMACLQQFSSIQSSIYNHFNHERHLISRQTFKAKRTTALHEWFGLAIA
ncbi:MAG: Transposase [Candidatus Tokpelaia hoelldobleri]|uniref:Transposase n=1 Tax=Candidatus Tokpelaia hoelldobleri TaxID=1902579 RepID=A0A1U9JWW3_9HYPH|nr:MAG: Transposase [Candidatus Tokpelaia hoelldoblerii]